MIKIEYIVRVPCRQGKQGDHQERLGLFCRQGPRRW